MVVGAISTMRLAMISHLLEILGLRSSNGSIKYYRRSGINQVFVALSTMLLFFSLYVMFWYGTLPISDCLACLQSQAQSFL